MRISFPIGWKLSQNEEEILSRLALSDAPVSCEELEAIIAPRRRGPIGRPAKIVLHYMRRKLQPHGIEIISRKGIGFGLSIESKAALVRASIAEQDTHKKMQKAFAA